LTDHNEHGCTIWPEEALQARIKGLEEAARSAVAAWDEFGMGVGLFAPALLEMPAFVNVYDAMQDLREEATP
jgi:hypothetical protein